MHKILIGEHEIEYEYVGNKNRIIVDDDDHYEYIAEDLERGYTEGTIFLHEYDGIDCHQSGRLQWYKAN